MKAEDWFGLGVRFAGVWCWIQAIQNALYFLDVRLGFSELRGGAFGLRESSPIGYLLYAAGYVGLALYFLLGADHLTRLTFGRSEPRKQQNDESNGDLEPQRNQGDDHASP